MSRVSLQTGTSSVTSDLDFASTRLLTDSALENITEWRQFSGEDMFRSKLRLQIRIDDFRKAQGGLTNTDIFMTKNIDRYQIMVYLVLFPLKVSILDYVGKISKLDTKILYL